jgi:hypothetical protein
VVAFSARKFDVLGIHFGDGGPLTTIIQGTEMSLSAPVINGPGDVAFVKDRRGGGDETMLMWHAGSLVPIATTSGALAGGFSHPALNAHGTVAFDAGLDAGGRAVVTGSGGPLTTIASTGALFDHVTVSQASLNDLGAVVFYANGSGIFLSQGGLVTTVVDTSSGFGAADQPSINNAGMVAFHGSMNSAEGIFTSVGGILSTLADRTTGFTSFTGSVAINDLGHIAFEAMLAGGHGHLHRPEPRG